MMSDNKNNCAVILAAGEGKRMKSAKPKVLMDVLFKPMLGWVTSSAKNSGIDDICVVTGHLSEVVQAYVGNNAKTVLQSERLGTGHAVMQAKEFIIEHRDGNVLVLNGDAPLMEADTIQKALVAHVSANNAVTVISAKVDNPFGYGRIVRTKEGALQGIVEEKDANDEIRAINEVNSGAYWFQAQVLLEALQQIKSENSQGEYYLTDAIGIILNSSLKADAFTAASAQVVLGANDRVQLHELNEIARQKELQRHRLNGVDIPCADGVIIGPDVEIGQDTVILPGTVIRGTVHIGRDCTLGPNSLIENSTIGNNVKLNSTQCYNSVLRDNSNAGPFAHIRPNSEIFEGVHLGNFVEVKNSVIKENTSVSHLTYIGDSDIGSGVNFGCGCITVNYDGKEKHRTTVKDNAFIGCNTNLIAPVTVGEYAYIAAGSTITRDIPGKALAIARAKQENKESWVERKKPYREKK